MMGLKITLKPKERMIIGNAVISNSGSSECNIAIENNATILREKNIMSEKEADTACKQIYFIIQLMYIDENKRDQHQQSYWKLVHQVVQAAPSTLPIIDEINQHILNDEYYQALKTGKKLVDYEADILNTFLVSVLKPPVEQTTGIAAQ